MPRRGAFTAAGFVLALVVVVVPVVAGPPVVPVVEPVVVPGMFGFFVLSDPVLGRGRRRLVLGLVLVLFGFSFGRVTRNAPRTSSWSSAAIEVTPNTETIAQAKRITMYFMRFSYGLLRRRRLFVLDTNLE